MSGTAQMVTPQRTRRSVVPLTPLTPLTATITVLKTPQKVATVNSSTPHQGVTSDVSTCNCLFSFFKIQAILELYFNFMPSRLLPLHQHLARKQDRGSSQIGNNRCLLVYVYHSLSISEIVTAYLRYHIDGPYLPCRLHLY